MGIIYPEQPESMTPSENMVYQFIRKNLPDYIVSYYNYKIGLHEFDFALLVPNQGIAILEVKEWHADQIVEIKDYNSIIYRNRNGEEIPCRSPLKQAERYVYELIQKIHHTYEKNFIVIPFVCYPNITLDEYHQIRLDIVSPPQLTICKDHFASANDFVIKITDTFADVKAKVVNYHPFQLEEMKQIRAFFETDEQIEITMPKIEASLNKKGPISKESNLAQNERKLYSILKYIPATLEPEEFNQISDQLVNLWNQGTKVIFVTDSKEYLTLMRSKVEQRIQSLYLTKRFPMKDRQGKDKEFIFNFFFYLVPNPLGDGFEIVDGDAGSIKRYEAQLQVIHQYCSFNFEQYKIEHAPLETNIMIRAGAGSGKTFTMIDRISYLIYSHHLDEKSLCEQIYLITFTNEAANNMRRRLQENFQNYYLLTKDYTFFKMIESLENMKISTIHSLAKRILQRFSSALGLGKDFRIVSGKYERNLILERVLERYLQQKFETEPESIKAMNLSMYHLQRRLRVFLEKLDNQNIDLLHSNLDFGYGELEPLHQVIQHVLKESEAELQSTLVEQNSVRLSDLMRKCAQLIARPDLDLSLYQDKIKYVFIDEFQDTDNVQIDLIKQFQEKLGFRLFVVGDIKQCIYRFRGAEDKAFERLTEEYERIDDWGYDYTLNKNYRSDQNLLKRFERVFEQWGKKRFLVYDPEKDALTSHLKLNDPDEEYFKEVVIQGSDSDFEQTFMECLRDEIARLNEKETLAILVRENWEAEKIQRLCLRHGIVVETDIGGTLYQSDPVLELYKLVLALQHNKSPKHLLNLYTTSYVSRPVSKAEIFALRNQPAALLDYFYRHPPIEDWEGYLKDLKLKPVLHVLWNLITTIQPWENYVKRFPLSEKDEERLKRYYKRNLDLVFEKMTENNNTDYLTINKIEKRLHIMITTKQSEESREEASAVSSEGNIKCMTVHKSKGLEFTTVMLPFGDQSLDKMKKGLVDVLILPDSNKLKIGYAVRKEEAFEYIKNNHYKREEEREKRHKLQEEVRILYVAMTRAIKRFVYFRNEESDAAMNWQNLIREGSL